jgi:hypothetical protein
MPVIRSEPNALVSVHRREHVHYRKSGRSTLVIAIRERRTSSLRTGLIGLALAIVVALTAGRAAIEGTSRGVWEHAALVGALFLGMLGLFFAFVVAPLRLFGRQEISLRAERLVSRAWPISLRRSRSVPVSDVIALEVVALPVQRRPRHLLWARLSDGHPLLLANHEEQAPLQHVKELLTQELTSRPPSGVEGGSHSDDAG